MGDWTRKEYTDKMHPLSKYLIDKIHTWNQYFGPLKHEDCNSVEAEISNFLMDLRDYCERSEDTDE